MIEQSNIQIQRIDREKSRIGQLFIDPALYDEIANIVMKDNPIISTVPIIHKYRKVDFYALLMRLGVERYKELTKDSNNLVE